MTTWRRGIVVATLACLSWTPAAAAAEDTPVDRDDEGFVLRAGGDVHVGREERVGAVVVLGGDALIDGKVGALLVVGGNAVLDHAEVGDLSVVGGRAELRPGSRITGEVRLVGSEMDRAEDVVIAGAVTRESAPRWGFFPFGFLFALGASLAVLAAGLLVLAVAPQAVRTARGVLVKEPGKTALAALVVWLLLPPLGVISLLTIVGIPLGVGLLLFVLPALAFLGYLLAGFELGERLFAGSRLAASPRRPYLAALLGVAILMLLGVLPVVGALVGLVASAAGGGAIALAAWRSLRARRARGAPPVTTPASGPLAGPMVPPTPSHP